MSSELPKASKPTPFVMDVTIYRQAGVPDTLLPTYSGCPRRPDGNRASRTAPMSDLPDCLDPRKMRLPMKPPVFYYGYPVSDEQLMDFAGHIRGAEREDGSIDMGIYAFKARRHITKQLEWSKYPLERVFGVKGRLIVFCTNYSNAKTKAATQRFIEPTREFLGLAGEPKWYVAATNRWYWE